jgi:hypothetical protein
MMTIFGGFPCTQYREEKILLGEEKILNISASIYPPLKRKPLLKSS